jgi:cob(I)alamin adenosyltransferase
MAEVAATPENVEKFRAIDDAKVTWVEEHTDALSKKVRMPSEFIIPGDTPASAALDLARTVVRRAERRVAELFHMGEIDNPQVLNYLNRLSSLCFVLELFEDQFEGQSPTLAKG